MSQSAVLDLVGTELLGFADSIAFEWLSDWRELLDDVFDGFMNDDIGLIETVSHY